MSQEQKRFLELLASAKKNKDINALSKKYEFDKYEGQELRDNAQEFGHDFVEKVGNQKVEHEKEVRALLEYIKKMIAKETFLECKDPLDKVEVTFEDIAGQQEVKADLEKNYIFPFTYPSLFKIKTKGILLYGPPGTGKTLMAKAATKKIEGAAFFAPTPGELKGKYEGETEKNISQVFDCADNILRENPRYTTSIIFMDEFDAIASARGDDPGMRRSVNALLQAMDGIKERKNTSVMAATNYPWDLDDAVLRRFTARIFIDLPDPPAIEWIIRNALIKNYAPPGSSKKDQEMYKNDGTFNDWIFDQISTYGGKTCEKIKEEKGYTEAVWGSDTVSLGVFHIGKIVDKLSANKPADKIKDSIKGPAKGGGKVHNPDSFSGAEFGYSASDVAKVMDIAIQDASFRALNGKFSEKQIPDETGEIYYVYDVNGTYNIGEIPDKTRIWNFTICPMDIMNAIGKYPPTVTPKEYIKLLNYVHHSRPE